MEICAVAFNSAVVVVVVVVVVLIALVYFPCGHLALPLFACGYRRIVSFAHSFGSLHSLPVFIIVSFFLKLFFRFLALLM